MARELIRDGSTIFSSLRKIYRLRFSNSFARFPIRSSFRDRSWESRITLLRDAVTRRIRRGRYVENYVQLVFDPDALVEQGEGVRVVFPLSSRTSRVRYHSPALSIILIARAKWGLRAERCYTQYPRNIRELRLIHR